DRLQRAGRERGHRRRSFRARGCALVHAGGGRPDAGADASRRARRSAPVRHRPSSARPLGARQELRPPMAASGIAPRILCIGIPVRDLTFRVEAVPARGSKANATHLAEICGGNALNAAIAIARLGGRVCFAGPMGDARETSSGFVLERMAAEGIETTQIVRMPGLTTPVSAIMIEPSGERTLTIYRDPALSTVKLPDADTLLADCRAVLVESRCAAFATSLCTE